MFLLLGVELLVLGVEPRALCMLDKFGTSDLNPQFPNTLKPLYPVTLILWARLGTRVKIIAQQNPGGVGGVSLQSLKLPTSGPRFFLGQFSVPEC